MDIRSQFLEFFKNKGHQIYSSMPLVPDDASLLFTNAGMVQFKDIFTGKIPPPAILRATSSQLCIRAGGKHNDLENVGYTCRHHTLFEMLGNFSFGDYFKEEAIAYAWEFVTEVLGFDKSVLYVTIHESDDEAFEIWSRHIDPSRIKRMGDKDNFWQMGDTGPCGPCSEIFVDQGEEFRDEEDYFGGDGDRFLEIWNLVFMQFERHADGSLTPLPKPSIDTGMGLERVMALLEKKRSNFDSSLFMPLIAEVENIAKKPYVYEEGASFRVIADHARAVAFLLAQGVNFDKEGRGYVLRRILRRAVRHGYFLGINQPFFYRVVEKVCDLMGGFYTYLKEKRSFVVNQCRLEEGRFFETIGSGIALFESEAEKLMKSGGKTLDGSIAFRLYDTFGFPLDITQDMLKERGLELDLDGFDCAMQKQRELAKISWKGSGSALKIGEFKEVLSEFGTNAFIGYTEHSAEAKILALFDNDFGRISSLKPQETGWVMLDKSVFYPESGGALGDKGTLSIHDKEIAIIEDTKKFFDLHLSQVKALDELTCGKEVVAKVDSDYRLNIARHHSATHLLHAVLRAKFGDTLAQAGSLVESTRLRFDFGFPRALSMSEILEVQDEVNALIAKNIPVSIEEMPLSEAKAKGAVALFNEKYADNVRVVGFGLDSCELCGGIHASSSGILGSFIITKESGVSSGVRRIEAICGPAAYRAHCQLNQEQRNLHEILKSKDIPGAIKKLKDRLKELEKSLQDKHSQTQLEAIDIHGVNLIVAQANGEIKSLVDEARNRYEKVAILLINENLNIVAGSKNTRIKASDWVREVAKILGGNGGGRDDFATAGGKDRSAIAKALEVALEYAKAQLL